MRHVRERCRSHLEDVYDISWSADSKLLLSGSVDNTAILWDVKKGMRPFHCSSSTLSRVIYLAYLLIIVYCDHFQMLHCTVQIGLTKLKCSGFILNISLVINY